MRTPNTVYGMLISFFLGICSVVLYADHQVSLSQSEVEQHRQAFLKNPHDGKSIRALAHYYYTHGEYAQAIPFYEKYKTLMPNEIEIHMKLGACYQNLSFFSKAKKEYRYVLRRQHGHKEALRGLAFLFEYENNLDQAVMLFLKLISLYPQDCDAHSAIGRIYARLGKDSLSFSYFQKALTIDPSHVNTLLGLADYFTRKGEYVQAEDFFTRIKRIDPQKAAAYYGLAQIYSFAGKDDRAIAEYNTLIRLDPYNAKAHFSLGKLAYKAKEYHQAEVFLKNAVRLNSQWEAPLLFLTKMYMQTGRYSEAYLLLKSYSVYGSSSKEVWHCLGIVAFNLKKYDEAQGCFAEMLRRDPYNHELIKNSIAIALQQKDYRSAERMLHVLVEQKGSFAKKEIFSNLAFVYTELGEYDKAIAYAQKSIEEDSSYIPAYEHLAYAYGKKGLFHESMDVYNKIAKKDPSNVNAFMYKGIILYTTGLYKESILEFEEALRKEGCPDVAYYYLGNIYATYTSNKEKGIQYLSHYAILREKKGAVSDVQAVRQKIVQLTQDMQKERFLATVKKESRSS